MQKGLEKLGKWLGKDFKNLRTDLEKDLKSLGKDLEKDLEIGLGKTWKWNSEKSLKNLIRLEKRLWTIGKGLGQTLKGLGKRLGKSQGKKIWKDLEIRLRKRLGMTWKRTC